MKFICNFSFVFWLLSAIDTQFQASAVKKIYKLSLKVDLEKFEHISFPFQGDDALWKIRITIHLLSKQFYLTFE